jgi:predicted metal-binding membrane protein
MTTASKTRPILILSLLAVIIFAWLYLFYQHWHMQSMPMEQMWMPPVETSAWQFTDFGLVYLMWAVMMAAMMLPSAIPMILIFAKVCKQRYQASYKFHFIFVLAYLLVWFIFSILLTVLQWQMHGLHFLSPMMDNQSERVAAAIFLIAGIYQFTPVKNTYLQSCRSPMGFLLNEWREGAAGAFYMGWKHGNICLGCCWAQMLIMFAVGVMNLLGMVLITALVLTEKIAPINHQVITRVVGVLFMAWGISLFIA